MTKLSPAGALISEDFKRWMKNTAVFTIPVILVLLGQATNYISPEMQYGAVLLYVINVIIDLLRKWLSENSYKVS